MANFNTTQFTDFRTNFTIHNGEIIDENTLGLAPLQLKRELNNVYNIQRMNNGFDPFLWENVETYLPGEIVTDNIDGLWYRSKMVTFNNQPSTSATQWEHITYDDISLYGSLDNYLAKNNTNVYVPTGDYNPATKIYVDNLVSALSGPDGYSTNAAGDYPTDFKGTGSVKSGSGFYITSIANGNMVGVRTVNVGDLLIALADDPLNDDTKWIVVESNRDQATESAKGVARIATQTEVDNGIDDETIVTPAKLASYAGNGSTTFIGLTDTPSNFTGSAHKLSAVNAGETALEYVSIIDNLTSTSANNPLSANQGRILEDEIVAMSIALG